MTHCEACQRDFMSRRRFQTCPYCGFNTNPRGHMPRSTVSLARLEKQQQERQERQEELRDYLGTDSD